MAVQIKPSDIRKIQGFDNTVYVDWESFSQANTKEYVTKWESLVILENGSPKWVVDSESTTQYKYSQASVRDGVSQMRFSVTPIAETYKSNDNNVPYYTAIASTYKYIRFGTVVDPPSAPLVESDPDNIGFIKISLSGIPDKIKSVTFSVIRDQVSVVGVYKADVTTIKNASYSLAVSSGHLYTAKAQYTDIYGNTSKWSPYADQQVGVAPAPVINMTPKVLSKDVNGWTIEVAWAAIPGATTYTMRYIYSEKALDAATIVNTFSFSGSASEISVPEGLHHCTFVSPAGGYYYFQVKSANEWGASDYIITERGTASLVVGEAPEPPTTWSANTTITAGTNMELFWSHNSKDGSNERSAKILLTFANNTMFLITVIKKASVSVYSAIPQVYIPTIEQRAIRTTDDFTIDTTNTGVYNPLNGSVTPSNHVPSEYFINGVSVKWTVQTAAVTGEYGTASIERAVNVYNSPTMNLYLTYDSTSTDDITVDDGVYIIEHLPFYIHADVISGYITGGNPVLSCSYSIAALSAYTYIDDTGTEVNVTEGQVVWSYFSAASYVSRRYRIDAGTTDFIVNNQMYKISVSITVNTGFTVQKDVTFMVSFDADSSIPSPDASIYIDPTDYTAQITPYCIQNGQAVSDVLLSVYRKEYDGRLTEVAANIENNGTFVTDPHPPLNAARYRIVATKKTTDESTFSDLPLIPVNFPHILIQWAESYSPYDSAENKLSDPPYSGSRVILPYNIDTNEDCRPSVSLVEYIGRENPVSYYGTMINETANWSCEIPKSDTETIYALRRLSKYRGDVYVREPSGIGYWANIHVTLSLHHNQVAVPVSLSITRVEGGI